MSKKRKTNIPKERNAVVMQLIHRAGSGSGKHMKSKKAERRQTKMSLRKKIFD